jgi:uncharacterized membrane protein YeaQ/YmgE (transglycosylase-associated protein family)
VASVSAAFRATSRKAAMPRKVCQAPRYFAAAAMQTPSGPQSSLMQMWARRPDIVPDTVNLIIWLVAGVAGGNAAGELVKGDYDLGPGNTVAGAIGGVVGTLILQALIPALRGIAYSHIIGQVIVAATSGAALTVIAAAVQNHWRHRR